jgi:hypothetical protein
MRTVVGAHPKRIREAAEALLDRGLRPTIQRVRAMLGGGSPNVIAPILKEWRETLTPEQQLKLPLAETSSHRTELPLVISDLAAELWKRAIVFATIECEGAPQALQLATMNEEAEQLRSQNEALLDQLEDRANEIVQIREQLAQLQATAKAAIERVSSSERRYERVVAELRTTKLVSANAKRDVAAKRAIELGLSKCLRRPSRAKVAKRARRKKAKSPRAASKVSVRR